jgi:hypothetical protein
MAHELANALQQAGRIRQCCAVEEPHVYVRSEYVDVAEVRIAQTCNRSAIMQQLTNFVPAFSHHLKPLMRDGSQFPSMLFHPRIDGGIAFDSTVESQQLRSHRRSIFAFGSILSGTLHEKRRGKPGRVRLFIAYPQPNVWLTINFGVVMARLAVDLRHFYARFAANGCQFAVVQRLTGNAAGMPGFQLYLEYAPARGNSAQWRRDAGNGWVALRRFRGIPANDRSPGFAVGQEKQRHGQRRGWRLW